MDSGASDTIIVLRDVFTKYKLATPWKGDLAKAENGDFGIIGEGHQQTMRLSHETCSDCSDCSDALVTCSSLQTCRLL